MGKEDKWKGGRNLCWRIKICERKTREQGRHLEARLRREEQGKKMEWGSKGEGEAAVRERE